MRLIISKLLFNTTVRSFFHRMRLIYNKIKMRNHLDNINVFLKVMMIYIMVDGVSHAYFMKQNKLNNKEEN